MLGTRLAYADAPTRASRDSRSQRRHDAFSDERETVDDARVAGLSPDFHERDVLSRMIAARRGRIATVIGAEDRSITGKQEGLKLRNPAIETFERLTISPNIATVAVLGVEIVQVHKDHPPIDPSQELARMPHRLFVINGANGARDPPSPVDIVNLPNGVHIDSALGEIVEQIPWRSDDNPFDRAFAEKHRATQRTDVR